MSDITKSEILNELDPVLPFLREVAREVMFAPQEKIRRDDLQEWVALVLEACDVGNTWVSDESMVGDFWLGDADRQERVAEVGEKLGLELKSGDYIVDVARRFRALHDDEPDGPDEDELVEGDAAGDAP